MVSIVIPSYQGAEILEKQLPPFIAYMEIHHPAFEILVVDDGSQDAFRTARLCHQNKCSYLNFDKNQGKGAAVQKGVLEAKGDFILFTDVDIPFQYENITSFIQSLQSENYELVVGDRSLPASNYFKKISFLRKLGSDFFSFLVSRVFTDGLNDTQCGLKGFKRDIARELFSQSIIKGFAFDVEVLYLASRQGYKRKRLPVQLRCNESSSVKVLYHGAGMLIDLFIILIHHQWKKTNT